MKRNLKISLMTELTELAKSFREGQQEYLQGMRRLKTKRKELTKFDDGEELDEDEMRSVKDIEERVQFDPVTFMLYLIMFTFLIGIHR